jgi:hypothetical protein
MLAIYETVLTRFGENSESGSMHSSGMKACAPLTAVMRNVRWIANWPSRERIT